MDPIDRMKFVTIGRRGTFQPLGKFPTSVSDADAITTFLATQKKPIVLHFHGGLVDEEHGFLTAEMLSPVYEAAGCQPLTVVWETGFLETVSRNIGSIYKTELFQELMKIVLRHAAKRLGVEAGARGSGKELTETEISRELLKVVPFGNTIIDRGDFARGGNVLKPPTNAVEVQTTQDLVEEDIREDLTGNQTIARLLERPEEVEPLEPAVRTPVESAQAGARGVPLWLLKPLAVTTYRVLKRYWDGHQHGFYPTVMEEIFRELYLASAGRWIWSSMKNAARDMFRPNSGLAGLDLHVGLYVIEKLAVLGLPINLVGHSAGSIAICELLAAVARDEMKLRIHNIAFLAPAATSDLFFNELTSREERFDRFRMITMQDDYESKDILVPYVYPRSLLYLVSGIMEEAADAPICGMQKFLSGSAPYDSSNLVAIRDFLQKNDRLVLSKTLDTAVLGFRSSALKHGGFNQDALTRESVQAFLQG
jgi:hypothetical protein